MKNYLNITFDKGQATVKLSSKPIGEETELSIMDEECLHGDIYVDGENKRKFEKKKEFYIDIPKFLEDINKENKSKKKRRTYKSKEDDTHLIIKCDNPDKNNLWNPGQYYIYSCTDYGLSEEQKKGVKTFDIIKEDFQGEEISIRISTLLNGQVLSRIEALEA
jgi:hypothetical protein